MRTRVEADADGRIVWVKASETDADAVRLRRESEVLRHLRHPNVVELVAEGTAELSFAFVGRSTLASAPPESHRQIADVLTAVSTVLEELHGAGIAHGGLSPAHCLLAPDQRIVLASWGRAIRISGPDHPAAQSDRRTLAAMADEWTARRTPGQTGRERNARRASAEVRRALTRRRGPTAGGRALVFAEPRRVVPPPVDPPRARGSFRHSQRRRREFRGSFLRLTVIAAIAGLLWAVAPAGSTGGVARDGMSSVAIGALAALQWIARFAALYGLAVSLVCTVAIATGSIRSREVGARLGPPWIQRLVAGLALAGLGASAARSAMPARPPAPAVDIEATPRSASPNPTTSAPAPSTAPPRSTIFRRIPTDSSPPTVAPPVAPPAAPAPMAPSMSTPARVTPDPVWTVRPGDHFWRIAHRTLSIAWGRAPTNREIDPYWRAIIALNRTRLVDARDPDQIYVGQVFELPPVPPAPDAAIRAA